MSNCRKLTLCLLLFGTLQLWAATTVLIPFGAPWRYNDFSDAGPDWFVPGYPDGDWNFGFAQLGYGDGDEETETLPGTTTYFRMFLTLTNPQDFASFTLQVLRDDGVAVYVNGTLVLLDNLPDDEPLTYDTLALTDIEGAAESTLVEAPISPALFAAGVNLIAVEVHGASILSDDMSFDLQLEAEPTSSAPPAVRRGPYLQVGTSSNIVIRWRTSVPSSTRAWYGTNASDMNLSVSNEDLVIDHEITATGLLPDTKYFYSIGTVTQSLASGASYFFNTSPVPGPARPTRIWAIGDFGTGYAAQLNVRNAYETFAGARLTDVWLMLGDNAYYSGLDSEYQAYVFNVYPSLLRQTVVWPTIGNHETAGSRTFSDHWDYYQIFSMPTNGQAGGVASGTEHFYSFDYANIHFICLDSMTLGFSGPNSPMGRWLRTDLAETTRDWIIAYWHHPPYTKGSHNSDVEADLIQMREGVLPVLESFGVDLVLSGHSHSYERSFLIDGFYGYSTSVSETNFIDHGDGRSSGDGPYLKPADGLGARRGTVYVVDGSSGGQFGGGTLDHPAMYYSVLTPGSLVIDINGLQLDATFLSGSGTIDDTFTIIKGDFTNAPQPALDITRADPDAIISWPTSIPNYRLEATPSLESPQWTPVNNAVMTNGRRKAVSLPMNQSKRFFQLRRVP